MILTAPASSLKEPRNPSRRYSDLPPSYDVAEAEPHGFLDGKNGREPTYHRLPEPLITESPSTSSRSDPLSPVRKARDPEPSPFYLDPGTGEPRAPYMVSDSLLTQCTQYGHVEKTKFGALSIIAAVAFFPWGLLCLMGNRVVYCGRCGLVLRGQRGCKVKRRGHCSTRSHHC